MVADGFTKLTTIQWGQPLTIMAKIYSQTSALRIHSRIQSDVSTLNCLQGSIYVGTGDLWLATFIPLHGISFNASIWIHQVLEKRVYLRITINGRLKILISKCKISSLSGIQHIPHLLCPLLERQLTEERTYYHSLLKIHHLYTHNCADFTSYLLWADSNYFQSGYSHYTSLVPSSSL